MDSPSVRRNIDKEWAVVSPFAYVGKSERATNSVSRTDCLKVTIVDRKNMYANGQQSRDLTHVFRLAPEGDRTRGFLVQAVPGQVDRLGDPLDDYRFVCQSRDFIGLATEMEAQWVIKEAELAAWQAKQQERQKIQEEAVGRIKVTIPETEENLTSALADLLGRGDRCSVSLSVGGTWNDDETAYNAFIKGTVSVDFYAFQRLLETVYEARDVLKAQEEVTA